MICRHCGKENQPQMKFCVYCGKQLPQRSAEGQGGKNAAKFCRTCGAQLDAASGLCPKCDAGRKKTSSGRKGSKTLLVVILILLVLALLAGGVVIALDLFGKDDGTVLPERTPAAQREAEPKASPTQPEDAEPADPTVPETEDPAQAAFQEVVDFCKEQEEQQNFVGIVQYLRNLTASDPQDTRYQELLYQYEQMLREQTLMTAEAYIEEDRFKQAALYIQEIQGIYDCDDFHRYLEVCKVNLSKPLSHCSVAEDTNHSGTSSDVCPGDWMDVNGIEHEDSVRFWVIEQAGYQNTEYVVYNLDKNYRSLSGQIATEAGSDAGSDAVIMIYLDGELVYTSPAVSESSGAVSFEIDVTGVSQIKVLCTTSAPSFNYCIVDAMLYEI